MTERPQYNLMMKIQHSNVPWTKIGVAWVTERGFSLKLNPGVTLCWRDFTDNIATLGMFPSDDAAVTTKVNHNVTNKSGVRAEYGHDDPHNGDRMDDEVPF